MRVLIDTSAWIAHFREFDGAVADALTESHAWSHEMVIGELALGSLPARDRTLADLQSLPKVPAVAPQEVLDLIEKHSLHGRGLGWVDANLILSCLMHDAVLLTRDAKLAREWNRLVR